MIFRLPTDMEIAQEIITRYQNKGINGAAYKFAQSYRLTPEDREELISQATYKLVKIPWRSKFRSAKNVQFLLGRFPDHPPTWTATELAKMFQGYVFTVIRKAMLDEIRRQRCQGLRGLGLHPVGEIHPMEPLDPDVGRDGMGDRTVAKLITEKAKTLLSKEEWTVVTLKFGFDGNSSRSIVEISKDAKLPRSQAQNLLDNALAKLRLSVVL